MESFGSGDRRRRISRITWLGTTGLLTFAAPAFGQAPPNRPPGQAPNAPAPPPTEPQRTTPTTPPPPDVASKPGATLAGGAAPAGGTTAESVATRAAATSYQARAATETLAGASARAEGAWVNFVPRIGLTARYTRLSDFTTPSLSGSGSLVGTSGTGVISAPLPGGTAGQFITTAPLAGVNFSFPLVLDNWLTQATISIPISDYFLKINQSYTASTHLEEAARFDVLSARAKSYADGKIAYYTWLRARESVIVANQSLQVAQAHEKDAQNQFSVGNASRADVLRAQTQVAAAELSVERAKSSVVVAEKQIRIAMHAGDDEKLEPGESLDGAVTPFTGNVKQLISEAHTARPELKSIEKNAEASRKLVSVSRNGRYPALSGFGDATYANPNSRRFPQSSDWFGTWSVGAQITWSPNDLLAAGPGVADAESRAANIEAQRQTTKDGIELEVTQAYQSVVEADVAMQTTTRQLESALEGYRVARELFNAGRGTSTTLIDAENALAGSRFDHLNARADARIARIRLEHAVGRDAHVPANPN